MTSFAVLTGDIVNSTKLAPAELDKVVQKLQSTCHDLSLSSTVDTLRFARVSGDGWQVAISPASLALRTAVILRATVLAQNIAEDTRISLAHGTTHGTLPEDLNAASGPAFTASGRALAQLDDPIRMRFADAPLLDALSVTLDALIQNWTATQAEAICHMTRPDPPTQSALAETLEKSKQAVSKSLKAAKADAILTALSSIESDPQDV